MIRALLAFSLLTAVVSAQFSVVHTDAPGTGFFSEEPRTPIGGNTGTTLGEQRRIVMAEAVAIWEEHITPDGPIVIEARFAELPCSAFGVTLAGAAPVTAFQNFPEAPLPDTFYTSALANHLAGRDLDTEGNEMRITINSLVDSDPSCGSSDGYYYGLDGNSGSRTAIIRTLIHEIGHGLGFTPVVDFNTGEFFEDTPDIYSRNLLYLETSQSWADLSNSERLGAFNAGPLTVWSGRNTQLATSDQINSGVAIASITRVSDGSMFPAQRATFGPALPSGGITAEIVLVDDGVSPTSDGCESPFVNASEVAGKIALIDRGVCDFVVKAAHAQLSGAVAVLIANTTPQQLIRLGGPDPGIGIPTFGITFANGQTLRSLPSGETFTILAPEQSGTSMGRPFIETPVAFASGSSVGHFDTSILPDLLMRTSPGVAGPGQSPLDLTLTIMRDMGWTVRDIPYPNLDFELWAEIEMIDPAGRDDDADMDGFSNLKEYAFSSDPDDPSSIPETPQLSRSSGNLGELEYTRTNQSTDLQFRVLELDTLPDLTPEFLDAGTAVMVDGEKTHYRRMLGELDLPRAFFQIEATEQ